jgi:hypothetical protein
MKITNVEPGESRATITDTPYGLHITIPAARNWVRVLFLAFWLCAWLFGEVTVLSIVVAGRAGPAGLFLVGWLGAWTFAGARTIYVCLWNLGGGEVVAVEGSSLMTRRQLFRFALPGAKEYELSQIRDLRASPELDNSSRWLSSSRFWALGGGSIAFDYGARTYRFGAGLDEAEAKQVAEMIKQRYPIVASGHGT